MTPRLRLASTPLRIALATTALLTTTTACRAPEPVELTILHTNDVHARFLEINRFGGACRPEESEAGECFGGAARRATQIAFERDAAAATGRTALLVDGGDQFQGTLFYGRYRGQAAAQVMNVLGYDAMVVGNHEFDDGPPVLAAFADALDFPLLGTNVDATSEPVLDGKLAASTVIERDGHRIGIVGYITEETPDLASPGPNLVFVTVEDALRAEIAELEAQGIDIIVALSHAGFQRDRAVARQVAGIDVVVGGHTNTYLANDEEADGLYPTVEQGADGNPALVVTAFAWGKYLGRLDVTFEDGRATSWSGGPILLNAQVAEDAAMADLIAPWAMEVAEFSAEEIGVAAVDLEGREELCRFGECNLGNLITNALLEHGRPQGVQIALQNGGGIRSSLSKGSITTGQFLEVMPFGNTASTFRLLGSDLINTLEHAVSRADDPDNDGTGRFLQVAGLRYAWTPNQAPGERIEWARLVLEDGTEEPIELDREYKIIFNAFNRNGGDGFEILRDAAIEPYDQGQVVSDVVIDYIRRNSPVAPGLENRIVRVP